MVLHRNAKLGLAGRYALVRAVEEWLLAEGGRGRLQRLAGDRVPLVASLASGERGASGRRSSVCTIARAGRGGCRGCSPAREQRRICAARRRTGWGPRLLDRPRPATRTRRSRSCSQRHGLSRPPRAGARAGAPLRVALPRRPAAHGRQAATRASTGPATPSPATARRTGAEQASAGRLRLRALDRRRPLPAWLRRAALDERAATVTALRRARARRSSPRTGSSRSG